ncbi:MAG: chloride channel protein, partial [Actinomycetota bacterium]
MLAKARLLLFAAIGGALTGCISFAFLRSLDWVTRTRIAHGWIVWLLPLAGLGVGAAYHYLGGRAKGGTPAVIEQAHTFTHGVPARMAPFIFGGSVIGHLFGASVGREGAALQMAGSVTDSAARIGRLPAADRRILVAASLAAGWGAVFAVPITGIVFTLQVTKHHRWRALVPAIVAAFTGKFVVDELGYRMAARPHLAPTHWRFALPFKLVLAGIGFGILARLFVWSLRTVKVHMARWFHHPPLRTIVG